MALIWLAAVELPKIRTGNLSFLLFIGQPKRNSRQPNQKCRNVWLASSKEKDEFFAACDEITSHSDPRFGTSSERADSDGACSANLVTGQDLRDDVHWKLPAESKIALLELGACLCLMLLHIAEPRSLIGRSTPINNKKTRQSLLVPDNEPRCKVNQTLAH